MKIFSTSRMLVVLGLLMAVSFSCSDDDKTDPTPTPTNDVQLKDNAKVGGKILTDKDGRPLYFFSKDPAGVSTCTGQCLVNWPIYSAGDLTAIKLDAGLDKADFGTITTGGQSQTTYKGWPLYYYKDDVAGGDANGDNVGTVWFAAKTDYTIMIASGQLVGNDGKSYKSDYTEGTGATQFFTDGKGRTLYAFVKDKNNKNNYTKPDFSNDATWPIYTADLKSLPTGVDKALFSTIDVFGKKQLTYKGWPLYYFGPDAATRGATKGVSVPTPGIWPIVNLQSPIAPN
ncbi:COG4315 family predicted lipoprotein [Dyadobacter sp. BHUBP1]|uniref:COG4315 family predicted lipoprotein n=1 Tax=Dyadobacter sp. BHUBP1 TaxID=3424178 RepID=UPI003D336178